MTRREFSRKISELIIEMIQSGESPVYDYMLRSADEQKRLYEAGLSKIDGVNKISAHQKGTAADIYLVETVLEIKIIFEWDKNKAIRWHNEWSKKGGKAAIPWELGHFEG